MRAAVPFAKLLAALRAGQRVSASGAGEGFTPLVVAALERDLQRPLVVVCASRERAQELSDGLAFFLDRPAGTLAPAVLLRALDTSPYHPITPNRFVVMERLAALFRMAAESGSPRIIVLPAEALATRTIPRAALLERTVHVEVEGELDRDDLSRRLDETGYSRVPVVEDPGTYAVRGGIIDVWSPLHESPVRLDLFGDLVESLRSFDPESQRSGDRLPRIAVPPAREVVLTEATVRRARTVLRQEAAELGIPAPQVRAILAELDEGIWPLGVEGWLPAFYEAPGTVADYLPPDALWCVDDPDLVEAALSEQRDAAERLYREATEQRRLAFPPSALFAPVAPTADLRLRSFPLEDERDVDHRVELRFETHEALARELEAVRGEDHAFDPAARRVRGWQRAGLLPVVVGATEGHAERLRGLFAHYDLRTRVWEGRFSLDRLEAIREASADVNIFVGELERGFVFERLGLAVLGHADILPQRRQRLERRSRAHAFAEATLESFKQLAIGDLVVHIDHGIGRYDGLVKLVAGAIEGDYLKLMYRGDDLLYVPIYKLDRIQRYVAGDAAAPRLDRLGGVTWEKARKRATKAAESMAKELIAIAAARSARRREVYSPADDYFEEFCAAFPYDETPDQGQAIADVLGDMDKPRPMDRLVCGDVGYGKTEVAMRAAFRAVLDRKQVAVLVPTTVLAEQHRITFEDRFRGYPVEVAALSRFRTKVEEAGILERLTSGRLDIVIGTHRLLSKDVRFRDLGLLVVDEEHRFGVRHKERVKQLKEMVDVLTLTATPIPRTLNMALSGLRDMSIIATPPTDRLAVRTLVSRTNDDVMREAIEREMKRSGQTYVVHNRVASIGRLAERIQALAPRARVLVGHGQMPEVELERVMLRFMAGDADVLVCTTIIESGLDIPRANTMIIHRADMLGLAQLYQLRGRIGRSNQRAYCYLLIPEPRNLAGLAQKRVAAMQRFTELGSGFHIASLDMELRGAGNLLGGRQSGHVKEVGLDLFCELLAEAVHRLEGAAGASDPLRRVSCEIKVAVPAFLPESYVPDVNLRLFFYKRIASARTREELEDSFEDLADRCGRPPEEAMNLFEITDLKVRCQRIGANSFSFSAGGLTVGLDAASPLACEAIVGLLHRPGSRWKLSPSVELVRSVTPREWELGFATAREAIGELRNFGETRGLIPTEAG